MTRHTGAIIDFICFRHIKLYERKGIKERILVLIFQIVFFSRLDINSCNHYFLFISDIIILWCSVSYRSYSCKLTYISIICIFLKEWYIVFQDFTFQSPVAREIVELESYFICSTSVIFKSLFCVRILAPFQRENTLKKSQISAAEFPIVIWQQVC